MTEKHVVGCRTGHPHAVLQAVLEAVDAIPQDFAAGAMPLVLFSLWCWPCHVTNTTVEFRVSL